jgi:hypothetical protein
MRRNDELGYDTPKPMMEISGGSNNRSGTTADFSGTHVLVVRAHLEDHGHTLLLTLTWSAANGAKGKTFHKVVADGAEADREVEQLLRDEPERTVIREGDGWVTHSE